MDGHFAARQQRLIYPMIVETTYLSRFMVSHRNVWDAIFQITLPRMHKMVAVVKVFQMCLSRYFDYFPWKTSSAFVQRLLHQLVTKILSTEIAVR